MLEKISVSLSLLFSMNPQLPPVGNWYEKMRLMLSNAFKGSPPIEFTDLAVPSKASICLISVVMGCPIMATFMFPISWVFASASFPFPWSKRSSADATSPFSSFSHP